MIDGDEVCRRIRANEAWRELPVMFLSSLEDARDKARKAASSSEPEDVDPLDRGPGPGEALRSR